MKTIYKGKDDIWFNLSIKDKENKMLVPSDLDTLTIHFFTDGSSEIVKNKGDVVDETVVHIEQEELSTLEPGALKMLIEIGVEDDGWNDSVFNRSAERLTGYFLKERKEVQP